MAVNRFELPHNGMAAARVCLAQRTPAGDPTRIRLVARRSGAYAAELRRATTLLFAGLDSTLWAGPAHRALADQLQAQAPLLRSGAEHYEQYALALARYAATLEEVEPRLAYARRRLQQRFDELALRDPMATIGPPACQVIAGSDNAADLLSVALDFKVSYDRWADALDSCIRQLGQAAAIGSTGHRHGLRAFTSEVTGLVSKTLSPFEKAILHPSLRHYSDCLSSLNTSLTVLGLGLLFICPPAGAACLAAATVLSAAQLAVDAARRARGEHLFGAGLGLELAAAVPVGGSALRGLRAADNVVHLVPGGGLLAHEGVGRGHTLAKHVGKSEEFLLNRLATEPNIRAASTFYDRETAESCLSDFIDRRAHEIADWLSGGSDDLVLNGKARHPVGFVFTKKAAGRSESAGIRLVLRRSSAMTVGYRIHTAMVTP
jgi:hypothetical protein